MEKKVPYEFCKLDTIDLKVAAWLHSSCPDRLYSYLEFIASSDYHRKGIPVNHQIVYNELMEVHNISTTLVK